MIRTYRILVVPGGTTAFSVTVVRDSWRGISRNGKILSKKMVLTYEGLADALEQAARLVILDQSQPEAANWGAGDGSGQDVSPAPGQPIG